VQFDGLDLTERRLYARVVAPQIRAYAPALLAGYRSPFGGEVYIPGRSRTPEQARAAAAREGRGYEPGTEPVLFAGFVITNSEVGDGAWSITPRIVAEICGNGLQITADIARAVHLGAKHEDGVVRYTRRHPSKGTCADHRPRPRRCRHLPVPAIPAGQGHRHRAQSRCPHPASRGDRTPGRQDGQVQRRHGQRDPGPLHPRWPAHRRRSHASGHQRRPDRRRRRQPPTPSKPTPSRSWTSPPTSDRFRTGRPRTRRGACLSRASPDCRRPS